MSFVSPALTPEFPFSFVFNWVGCFACGAVSKAGEIDQSVILWIWSWANAFNETASWADPAYLPLVGRNVGRKAWPLMHRRSRIISAADLQWFDWINSLSEILDTIQTLC